MTLSPQELRERDIALRQARLELEALRGRQVMLDALQAGVHRTPRELYAHCSDPYDCNDEQVRVEGVVVTTAQTYRENGGDGLYADYIERSWQDLEFANPDDVPCPRCQKPRQLSAELRPVYPNKSGHDPRALVTFAKKWLEEGRPQLGPGDVFQKAKPEDERVAELERQVAELKALVEKPKRKPPERKASE